MSQPNILLFVSDQHHYSCFPGRAADGLHLPNLCWLAERGMVFDRAYCTTPICTPARASILTGRNPSDTGVVANYSAGMPLYPFDAGLRTLGHDFAAAGHDTAYCGKWHIPTGAARPGFNAVLGRLGLEDVDDAAQDDAVRQAAAWGLQLGHTYPAHLRSFSDPGGDFHGRATRLPLNACPSVQMMQRAGAWLREAPRRDKPFLLACSCIEPHPLGLRYDTAPAPFDRMYDPAQISLPDTARERNVEAILRGRNYHGLKSTDRFNDHELRALIAGYFGAVSFTDFLVGLLLEALAAADLLHNTVVVFTADHGEMLARHRMLKKGPVMYDDLTRVPLLIAHGGGGFHAARTAAPVSHIDLRPTLIDMAGISAEDQLPGQSLHPALGGDGAPDQRPILMEYHSCVWGERPTPLRAIVEDGWKLVVAPEGPVALYDMTADPEECSNRVAGESARLSRMTGVLAGLLAGNGDPWPAFPRPGFAAHEPPGAWE